MFFVCRCCAQNGMEAFRDFDKILQKPQTIRALKSKSQLPYDVCNKGFKPFGQSFVFELYSDARLNKINDCQRG